MTRNAQPQCIITRSDALEVEIASGAMTRLAGVSETLSGSTGIHLAISTVPPGRCATAHYHANCESALYLMSGKGLFLHGENLEIEEPIGPGDFIYLPSGSNHQPVNTSDDEDMVFIVARNAPVEIVVDLPEQGRQDCK